MKGVAGVGMHQYIIFINKLYWGIFILPTILTPSMFAYLIWENKDGKEMKAMFQIDKAIKMVDKMRENGVDPKFIIAQPTTYIK